MRLYNEAADVRDYRVRATHAGHGGEPASAFFTEIAGLVDADHDPWKSFSETVADAVHMRAQHLRVRRYCDRP